jgi:hypothetical protein
VVYPRFRGRAGVNAKPRSAHAYAIAVIRIFQRDHAVPMPRIKLVEGAVRGLLRAYKDIYGADALAPRRRQPMGSAHPP